MANDLQQQLERVQAKASVVAEKYQVLKANYDAARQEISELKAEVMSQTAQIEKLRRDVEYLTVASHVRVTGEDLNASRVKIANLVREIDHCIADLIE
jgi:peptidoglycan hydrolase CwlO-like protein